MSENRVSERDALASIETQMQLMVNGTQSPYDAGSVTWEKAMRSMPNSPELMRPLWLIWGSLTDWLENRPGEKAKAEATMLRAAKEWLSMTDESLRKAYLERWVYEECGYERPSGGR